MTRITSKMIVVAVISLGIWAADIRADNAQWAEKLRQDLTIKLDNVTIAQALEQIGQKAGMKIALSPEAVWKLPEGDQTRLSVTLEGGLAESLEKMLNSFFMRYAVGSDSLTIYPREELKHVIGRPTAGELKLLTNLYGSRIWISGVLPAQKVINLLLGEPTAVVPTTDVDLMNRLIIDMAGSWSRSEAARDANSPRQGTPVTVALLLEGVARSQPTVKTWYLVGPEFPRQVPEIRIVEKQEFRQSHLDQIVDVSFVGEKGESVVRKLATWAGLEVQIDRKAAQWLDREITLEVQDVKLTDALGKVLSTLGVGHRLNEGVLQVYWAPSEHPASEQPQQVAGEPQAGTGYIGKISIPMDGGRYFIEFMLRESDLPEPLRKLRQEAMTQVITELSGEGKMKGVLEQLSSPSTRTK